MTGDSEFSFSYWNWLNATDRTVDMLFTDEQLGLIDGDGIVNANSKYYGINNGWELVCLYNEDNDPRFRDVCDPTVPSGASGLTQLQRCPDKTKCMPEQNTQWPSLPETRKAINEMHNYRSRAGSNNVFNKYNTDSFSNYLEGWDPALPSTECARDELFCGKDNIPRRLHNLVRTTCTKYTHNHNKYISLTH